MTRLTGLDGILDRLFTNDRTQGLLLRLAGRSPRPESALPLALRTDTKFAGPIQTAAYVNGPARVAQFAMQSNRPGGTHERGHAGPPVDWGVQLATTRGAHLSHRTECNG